ncbi:DeoR/GlpR family DNA-binding transcription regulator [Cohnella suwonensis]|uniref:DeoR/GlpR family DNA-binding transcription regulator n=1 Tax=Cohnella suwonensis TaxID=696072 RepID=A0ABW0LR65_9BACL
MTRNKSERQEQVLDYLERFGAIALQEMTEKFDCSEATARRDLEELEKTGRVIRTMGGGAKYGNGGIREVSFHEKQGELYLEKEAIAEKAASLVEEGDVIGLTGGSTTFMIARALKKRRNLTIVTNAVNIAMELADSDTLQVVLTGGVLRGRSFELCGPLAEQAVRSLNVHKMFMGVDGVIAQGVSTYSELEANIAKRLMERSGQTIAVFDRTKIGKPSLFHVASFSELKACITDGDAGAVLGDALTSANVAVYRATPFVAVEGKESAR